MEKVLKKSGTLIKGSDERNESVSLRTQHAQQLCVDI